MICSNVLERVSDDRAALGNMAALLPDGGRIFLLVPTFMALYGEHDRADHHHRRYIKKSLRETVSPLPLEIDATTTGFPRVLRLVFYVRLMRRQLDEGGIGLYDKMIPLIRTVEKRVRPPFDQTLVAVLRRAAR